MKEKETGSRPGFLLVCLRASGSRLSCLTSEAEMKRSEQSTTGESFLLRAKPSGPPVKRVSRTPAYQSTNSSGRWISPKPGTRCGLPKGSDPFLSRQSSRLRPSTATERQQDGVRRPRWRALLSRITTMAAGAEGVWQGSVMRRRGACSSPMPYARPLDEGRQGITGRAVQPS